MTFNGVNLNFSSTTTITRNVTINNGSLNANNLTVNSPLYINGGDVTGNTLYANSNITLNANGKRPSYSVKTSTFNQKMTANGYDFINFYDLYFAMPNTYNKDSTDDGTTAAEFARITLANGGVIRSKSSSSGYGIHIYPQSTDHYMKKYFGHLAIVGPYSGSSTVNSNFYIGNKENYKTNNYTMATRVRLLNNVTLELNNGYEIELTPYSYIDAQTPAAIKISSVKAWSSCSAIGTIYQARRHDKGLFHGCNKYWNTYDLHDNYLCKSLCDNTYTGYAYFIMNVKASGKSFRTHYVCCTKKNCGNWPTVTYKDEYLNFEDKLSDAYVVCEDQ